MRRIGEKLALKLYLLDNSTKTLLIRKSTTASDVCRALAEKVGFARPERDHAYFAVYQATNWIPDGTPLPPERLIMPLVNAWKPEENRLLLFQLKLFVDAIVTVAASECSRVEYCLYIQAVRRDAPVVPELPFVFALFAAFAHVALTKSSLGRKVQTSRVAYPP